MIDYENKELMEHILMAMKTAGGSLQPFTHLTELGCIDYKVLSMPGDTIKTFDEEGNHIASDLAFLIEAKSPRFTMTFKVSADSWFDNEMPPEVKP